MSFLKKLFGLSDSEPSKPTTYEEKSPYAPTEKLPIDDRFMKNFIENGGKFIYCENIDELKENFTLILEENNWFEKTATCFDMRLNNLLEENNVNCLDKSNPEFFFSFCEKLIAQDGSILLSSNQLKHHKPQELPKNMVVYATTSQIVENKSDGLQFIKKRYNKNYPTNITTVQHFKKTKENDFMHYGSVEKTLYLLLLEDL